MIDAADDADLPEAIEANGHARDLETGIVRSARRQRRIEATAVVVVLVIQLALSFGNRRTLLAEVKNRHSDDTALHSQLEDTLRKLDEGRTSIQRQADEIASLRAEMAAAGLIPKTPPSGVVVPSPATQGTTPTTTPPTNRPATTTTTRPTSGTPPGTIPPTTTTTTQPPAPAPGPTPPAGLPCLGGICIPPLPAIPIGGILLAASATRQPLDLATVLAALAAFAPLVWKIVDFVKYARSKDLNAVTTQGAAWVAGIVIVALAHLSDFATGTALEHLRAATVILVGLSIGSVASAAYDFKKAKDNTDTATVPSLLTGKVRGARRKTDSRA